ncbi:MAG: histidine kinase [Corynebacterium sp.]|uniref:sensor histidine kinase n=1 Tax=Corynebacterium sp. TaxID=1720 RepID=UPI0026DDC2D8|nr:histidine kinase [Corynebacterium sp.]MDO5029896.1 histidine kinase [Corynebacterium sp.]
MTKKKNLIALAWSFILGLLFIPGLVVSVVLLPWIPLIGRGADWLSRWAAEWSGTPIPNRVTNRWFDIRNFVNLLVQLVIGFVTFTAWVGGGFTVGVLAVAPFMVDELYFLNWTLGDPAQKIIVSWIFAILCLALTIAINLGAGLLSIWLARAILAPSSEEVSQSRDVLIDSFSGERRRIERELHDGPQQHLTALKLNIAAARLGKTEEEVAEALSAADHNATQALAQLRTVVLGIAPPVLFENGLVAAVEELAAHSGMQVSVHQEGVADFGPLDETTALLAYHCAAEGLTNATKHGHADRAEIDIAIHTPKKAMMSHRGTLTVSVHDNGTGLKARPGVDAADVVKHSDGTGIAGLRERAAALGGTVTLTSAGDGAELLLELPIHGRTR